MYIYIQNMYISSRTALTYIRVKKEPDIVVLRQEKKNKENKGDMGKEKNPLPQSLIEVAHQLRIKNYYKLTKFVVKAANIEIYCFYIAEEKYL